MAPEGPSGTHSRRAFLSRSARPGSLLTLVNQELCLVLRMHSRLHIEIMTRLRSRWSTCRPLLAHRAESAHQRRVSALQPSFGATDCSTAHSEAWASRCSSTIRTARSRTSGENRLRRPIDLWVANYYSARNPLRLSSVVILGVVARMFRCATRSSCWCT